MQVVQVKNLTSTDARAARFQSAFLRAGRPAVRPIPSDREAPASQKWTHSPRASEHHPALDSTTALVPVHIPAGVEARGPTETSCADGEVPLVVCWDSSSAFICEIRGKPVLSGVNATQSPHSVAECGGARSALRIDPD